MSINFEFLSEKILDCNLCGCEYHHGLPLIETYEKLFNEKKRIYGIQIWCWCSIYSI